MGSKSVWSGHVSFGLVSIPVKLYVGARDEHVSLNFFHVSKEDGKPCGSRTQKPDWCPACKKQITREEIVRGYDRGDGSYIAITKDDLEAIAPESDKTMEISQVVKWDDVPPQFLAESFYVLPEGPGQRGYALFAKALRETGRCAIAQLTKTGREHVVLIKPAGRGLMLHCLYYPTELNRMTEFDGMAEAQVGAADLKLAKQLLEQLDGDFRPEEFENGYDQRLNQLIASRLDAKQEAPKAIPQKKIGTYLMSQLQASLKSPKAKAKKAA